MAQSQSQVIDKILKRLSYPRPLDIPSRGVLEAKLLSGDLTLREAIVLDMYARGLNLQPATASRGVGQQMSDLFSPKNRVHPDKVSTPAPSAVFTRLNSVLNAANKAGFELNTPFKDIVNNRESLEKISKHGKVIDPHLSGIFQSVRQTQTVISSEPLLYQNPKEKGAGLEGAAQKRGTRKFTGVPPAQQAFPELIAGISTVEDTSVRNALLANTLAPYRPGEIANLRLGEYDPKTVDVDRPPGYFDIEKGAIIFPEKAGKKAATTLYLDKNSILYNLLASQAEEARSQGSSQLFPGVTTGKMTEAIKGNVMPRMSQFEGIMGRPFEQAQDLRKLTASMIVGELGYASEAEQLLGHSDAKLNQALTDVGSKHYISQVVRADNPLSAVQLSTENMIGEALGLNTLNETAARMGLDIPGYTDASAKPVEIVRTGGELTETTRVAERPLSTEEMASIDAQRERASADARLAAQEAEARALSLEEANLAKSAELQSQREAARQARKEVEAQKPKGPDPEKIKAIGEKHAGIAAMLAKFKDAAGKGGKFALGALGITGIAGAGQEAYAETLEETGSEAKALGAGALRVTGEVALEAAQKAGMGISMMLPQKLGSGELTDEQIRQMREPVPPSQRVAPSQQPAEPTAPKTLEQQYQSLFEGEPPA